jgi:tetratricopeptide (TPR) repeat protein
MEEALSYYKRAEELKPNNPKVLLCVARTHHELENYESVSETYRKIKDLDPDLANRFAYLDLKGEEDLRAAESSRIKEVVLWEEE